MIFQILLCQVDFGVFSYGCRKEDYFRNICSGCYVLNNGDLYTRLSSSVDQAVCSLFSGVGTLADVG
jgi:hypothetical protein